MVYKDEETKPAFRPFFFLHFFLTLRDRTAVRNLLTLNASGDGKNIRDGI